MDVSIGLPHFVLLPGMCVDECCQGCAAGLRWMKLSSEDGERRAWQDDNVVPKRSNKNVDECCITIFADCSSMRGMKSGLMFPPLSSRVGSRHGPERVGSLNWR